MSEHPVGGDLERTTARRDLLLALGAFLFTVIVAVASDWHAADIVWSMWITSLVSGYWLVLLAVSGRRAGKRGVIEQPDYRHEGERSPAGAARTIFLLVFFSVHFLFFHFAHESIMQRFFPLPGDSSGHLAFGAVVFETLGAYWPVVVAALVSQHGRFLRAAGDAPAVTIDAPYRAVIRNHLVIFLVAGMNALGVSAWLLYALLVVCFFPFDVLRRAAAKGGGDGRG